MKNVWIKCWTVILEVLTKKHVQEFVLHTLGNTYLKNTELNFLLLNVEKKIQCMEKSYLNNTEQKLVLLYVEKKAHGTENIYQTKHEQNFLLHIVEK